MARWVDGEREKRRHRVGQDDQREPFPRDNDRVLYSSAFRRLSGVTQIVRANEADIFHHRLAHTLKVAQVGRRVAEFLRNTSPELAADLGLDPDVVAAACLIHDLGHPPFGHLGEKTLHDEVIDRGDVDGFEGNAQSFRIVTHLSVRWEDVAGLDLTRATLRATLKYPWYRNPDDPNKNKKWGAYQADSKDFEFAMDKYSLAGQSPEAALMDWADDIAYSVHDMEDMHRARLIPWSAIYSPLGREALVEAALKHWHGAPPDAAGRIRDAYKRVTGLFEAFVPGLVREPYDGRKEHRQQLRFITSTLIGRYITATSLSASTESGISVPGEMQDEVRLLKQLARSYLIENPALAAQQHGQRKIIKDLFYDLFADDRNSVIPIRFRYLFDDGQQTRARAVADLISGLTEAEIVALHKRLRGTESGSVLNPIVW